MIFVVERGVSMKKVKQLLAILLVFSMILTIAPEWTFAAVSISEESFIMMTEGQVLHHTVIEKEYYVFEPEVSGWYELKMEDVTKNTFTAGVFETIYYTQSNDEQIEHTKEYGTNSNYYEKGVSVSDHIMWLNQDEKYVFYCTPFSYENPDTIDVTLQISSVEIADMTVIMPPSEPSVKSFIGTGMQVKIQYADDTEHYTISNVSCNYQISNDGSGYSTNRLNALSWSEIAYSRSASIDSTIQIRSIDNKQVMDFADLEEGEHTAGLGIYYTDGETSGYYELSTTFEKIESTIESISVIQKRDTYTQWFGEYLEYATIKVTYNDGTPDATLYANETGNGGQAYQYLSYEQEGFDGEIYTMHTYSIDEYLRNGGTLGDAEVTVAFQGRTITYPITIEECPYDGISEVKPERTVFYANAKDSISTLNAGQITVTRNDGNDPVELALSRYTNYLQYGLEINGNLYKDIDAYIKAGGTLGEQKLKITYLDYEAETTVEIRDNPYERIELLQEPTKTTYTCGNRKIDFSGLVFVAHKADGTYDTYTYGENNNTAAVEGWSRFFNSSYKDKYVYLYEGTYEIDITFMNFKAEYEIQVEKVVETEEIYSDFKILKAPERNIFFTAEKESAVNNCLSEKGLEIEAVNAEGITKKYRVWYYPTEEESTLDGYSSWGEISEYISIDWSRINWSVPGTYPVTVSCQELTDTFDVTITDSPIVSFELIDMPQKNIYYRYEGKFMVLQGMSYKITFDDGTIFAETIKDINPDMMFTYQGNLYRIKKSWKKKNSSGNPTILEDNGIIFSVFGQDYETDPIQIKDDPVESVELLKNPEKDIYVGIDTSVDLYDAQIRIRYTDGTTEEIEVTEHTDAVPVDRYGKSITGTIQYMSGTDASKIQKHLLVSYMNQSANLNVELPLSEEDIQVLTDGGQVMATYSKTKPYQVIKFTPEETKNYYFYSMDCEDGVAGVQYCLELYNNEERIFCMTISDSQMPYSAELTAGTDYYYVISMLNLQTDKECQYYISSEISDMSSLGTPEIKILSAGQTIWYDYEMEYLYLGLEGTSYQMTYENGWTVQKNITGAMSSVMIGDKSLKVDWKYKDPENTWRPEIRNDNALVYTYGDDILQEVPVQLNVESDVESITIDKNPYENCYLYEVQSNLRTLEGLTVTIHYTGDKQSQTVVWEDKDDKPVIDGRLVDTVLSANGSTYTLEVRYMGVSAKEEILFLENPVSGFAIKSKPAKSSYYVFERSGTPDLYGMDFTIQYSNGTTQDIQVSEHTGKVYPEDGYKEAVKGSIRTENREDASGNIQQVKVLYLNYLGYTQEIMEYELLPLPTEDADAIELNDLKYIVLDEEQPFYLFKVTAENDNQFSFSANGKISKCLYLYDASGKQKDQAYGSSGISCKTDWRMAAGETNYLLVMLNENGRIASIACDLTGEEIQKEEVDTIEMSISNPVAGNLFPLTDQVNMSNYKVDSCQWYGDEEEDGCADFATAHRLKLVLAPLIEYCFTENTKIVLNGEEITTKTLGSDGKITVYYTFPYTECKLKFSQMDGYTLHTDKGETDRIEYGGNCKFWYTDMDDKKITDWIVKANQNPLTPDEEGCYTLSDIKENISITVKEHDIPTDENASKLQFYNQSDVICDVMTGVKNKTIAENTAGENYLPEFASYADERMQFFYGWYLDKDEAWNGIHTRFTRNTVLLEDIYDLYAKWGTGSFSSVIDGKEVNYRVLSFDEDNRMTVEIISITVPSKAVLKNSEDIDALGGDKEVLEIPDTLGEEQISLPEDLDIDIESCTVTALAPNAFSDCDSLDQIILPDTITKIPENAFSGCKNLTVTLPDTVTEIDADAFTDTQNVTVICSSQLAENGVSDEISHDENVTLQTVDILLEDGSKEKQFFYGDEPETFKVQVKVNGEEVESPVLNWQYPKTDAFSYEVEGNTLTVTPKRITSEEEKIAVVVWEENSRLQKSILLNTVKGDLGQTDETGATVYEAKVVGTYTYLGEQILPTVIVKKNTTSGKVLEETDYTIECSNNLDAGTATYKIIGTGNYTGSIEGTFTIEKACQNITANNLVKNTGNVAFSIGAKTDGEGRLSFTSSNPAVADVDAYGIARVYHAGETTIGITAEETKNYKASATKYITLIVQPLESSLVKTDETGKSELKVYQTSYTKAYKSSAFQLNVSADGPISYKSSNTKVATVSKTGKVSVKNCGIAMITVSTQKESKNIKVQVVPKKAKASVSSKKSGELKISWTKQSEAAGYVVEYSADKNFKKNVSKKVISKNKTTSVTIKKLSKGKKYYARVKAYTVINKKRVYGEVSKTAVKKIKK